MGHCLLFCRSLHGLIMHIYRITILILSFFKCWSVSSGHQWSSMRSSSSSPLPYVLWIQANISCLHFWSCSAFYNLACNKYLNQTVMNWFLVGLFWCILKCNTLVYNYTKLDCTNDGLVTWTGWIPPFTQWFLHPPPLPTTPNGTKLYCKMDDFMDGWIDNKINCIQFNSNLIYYIVRFTDKLNKLNFTKCIMSTEYYFNY